MDKALTEILSDRKSGSTTLALKLNDYIKSIADDKDKIYSTIRIVKDCFTDFAIINYFIDNMSLALEKNSLRDFLYTFESDVINSNKNLYSNAKKYIAGINKVYTLSNSNTLVEFFRLWKADNPSLSVYISESRPANEGRSMAASLLDWGINVHFFTDYASAGQIKNVDAVLIGADKILANGDIINKAGSLATAISCKYFNKPFYVAASKYKFSKSFIYDEIPKEPEEVWNNKHINLTVHNDYFDEIPSELISRIFCD